jgi:hypothetical protein
LNGNRFQIFNFSTNPEVDALGAFGFVTLLIYISKYKTEFNRIISKNGLEEYSLKQKVSKFIFAPAMIIAIIVFLIQAISMISFGSGVAM